jgi:hypothetical protein
LTRRSASTQRVRPRRWRRSKITQLGSAGLKAGGARSTQQRADVELSVDILDAAAAATEGLPRSIFESRPGKQKRRRGGYHCRFVADPGLMTLVAAPDRGAGKAELPG